MAALPGSADSLSATAGSGRVRRAASIHGEAGGGSHASLNGSRNRNGGSAYAGGFARHAQDDGGAAKDRRRRRRRNAGRYGSYAIVGVMAVGLVGLVLISAAARRQRRRHDPEAPGAAATGEGSSSGNRILDRADELRREKLARRKAMMQGKTESSSSWLEEFWGLSSGKRKRRSDEVKMLLYGRRAAMSEEARQTSGGYIWVEPRQLPPLPGAQGGEDDEETTTTTTTTAADGPVDHIEEAMSDPDARARIFERNRNPRPMFKVYRERDGFAAMEWEAQQDGFEATHDGSDPAAAGPRVDYNTAAYQYAEFQAAPPKTHDGKLTYPYLQPLKDVLDQWPQDELDNPPRPIVEHLQRFDYTNPDERAAALKFREAELPFKVYNVPELLEANKKWTDEYVASHFDRKDSNPRGGGMLSNSFRSKNVRSMHHHIPRANGHAQESENNFFAFYNPMRWDVDTMGPPPTVDNDWPFAKWAKHARYADRVQLKPNERHFYWQAGVLKEERLQAPSSWCFISRDLPSFSNPEPTFFGFNPPEQKGIQCRFGERGVTAATHYDAGRNMVAMITGAKRYILSPPKACPKLGIVARRRHPVFRHSLLNFAHLSLLRRKAPEAKTMPEEEKSWLELSADSLAVETVLKEGEVLYIPSHWFHYITSLQKSAQCNTRSGREFEGTTEFGSYQDVVECVGEGA